MATDISSPPPGRGRAVIVASWARAIALAIERPSPTPSAELRRCLARANGSNRVGICSAGTLGPVLAISNTRAAVLLDRADSDPATRVVVPHGVLDEVGDHALEQHAVAAGDRRLERSFDLDVALIDRCMRGVERVLGGGGEVDRFLGRRADLARGERQERLDGRFGALDRALDPSRHRLELLGRPRRL